MGLTRSQTMSGSRATPVKNLEVTALFVNEAAT